MLERLHTCSARPALHTFTSLHLHRYRPTSSLQTSIPIPPCLHAYSAPQEPQSSVPLCFYVYTTARLQRSIPLVSARLQRASRVLQLHRSTSLYLHRASRLQTSIPSRLHVYIAPLEIQTSIPPRCYTCSPPPALHLHVATLTSSLQTSRPPDLYTSISAHLQLASGAPYLHTSTSLRL